MPQRVEPRRHVRSQVTSAFSFRTFVRDHITPGSNHLYRNDGLANGVIDFTRVMTPTNILDPPDQTQIHATWGDFDG